MMKLRWMFVLLLVHRIYANDISIIASPSCHLSYISKKDIQNMFLKKEEYLHHVFVQVLDNQNVDTYRYFVKHFLEKSPRQIKTYWLHMLFTGKKSPPKRLNKNKIEAYQKDICYISYIEQQQTFSNWKAITVR